MGVKDSSAPIVAERIDLFETLKTSQHSNVCLASTLPGVPDAWLHDFVIGHPKMIWTLEAVCTASMAI